MITPSNFARSIEPIMRDKYGLAYNRYETEYTEFHDVQTSNKKYEEHIGMAGFGLVPEKGIGVAVSYSDPKEGFLGRISQTVYGLGFIVAYEMYLWQQDRRIEQLPKALAQSVHETKETLGINTLDRAFNSAYKGADGLELCSEVHVRETGGTYANEPTTASDLNADSFEQALIDIAAYTDPAGLKFKARPKKLITGMNNWRNCTELFGSPQEPDTANNAKNFAYNAVPWMISHYLTSTKAWFIVLEGENGLINFVTRKPDFTRDNEFSSENALFKTVFNMGFGWEDPRRIYGSPGVS